MSERDWQVRVVLAGGEVSVRFLSPNRHTMVEIPVRVVAQAAVLAGYEVEPKQESRA